MSSAFGHGATCSEELKQQAGITHWELRKSLEL